MEHNVPLITTLAAALGTALVLGFAAERLKLPALVGYLVAGILIGPATPGFVADVGIASQLSEIGVMLLMFGVGLHFSMEDLLAVRRIAVPGAVVQMGLATVLGMARGAVVGKVWKCRGRFTSDTACHIGSQHGCHIGSMSQEHDSSRPLRPSLAQRWTSATAASMSP